MNWIWKLSLIALLSLACCVSVKPEPAQVSGQNPEANTGGAVGKVEATGKKVEQYAPTSQGGNVGGNVGTWTQTNVDWYAYAAFVTPFIGFLTFTVISWKSQQKTENKCDLDTVRSGHDAIVAVAKDGNATLLSVVQELTK